MLGVLGEMQMQKLGPEPGIDVFDSNKYAYAPVKKEFFEIRGGQKMWRSDLAFKMFFFYALSDLFRFLCPSIHLL